VTEVEGMPHFPISRTALSILSPFSLSEAVTALSTEKFAGIGDSDVSRVEDDTSTDMKAMHNNATDMRKYLICRVPHFIDKI
jgi:hypothetical protein